MNNVLVTGATSFIGIKLIHSLLDDGRRVYGTVRDLSPKVMLLPKSDNLQLIPLAMAEFSRLTDAIQQPIDVVFHLAWQGLRGTERENEDLQLANMNFSLELLHACNKLNCRSFIDAGSQAEYGKHNIEITEDSALQPENAYGKYKLRTFQQTADFCSEYGINYHHPRIFCLYGPGDDAKNLLPTLIRSLLAGQDFPLTSGMQYWDFLHINDAVRAFLHLAYSGCEDGAYNLASGDCRRLHHFVEETAGIINSNGKLLYGTIPTPPGGLVSIKPSINKLLATGWKPKVPFNAGIKELIFDIANEEKF